MGENPLNLMQFQSLIHNESRGAKKRNDYKRYKHSQAEEEAKNDRDSGRKWKGKGTLSMELYFY